MNFSKSHELLASHRGGYRTIASLSPVLVKMTTLIQKGIAEGFVADDLFSKSIREERDAITTAGEPIETGLRTLLAAVAHRYKIVLKAFHTRQ